MSYNVIAYILYLAATLLLIVWVGLTLYSNGRPFVLLCFNGNAGVANAVNKTLLTGYYLVNTGYAAYSLKIWEKVSGWQDVLETVGTKIGFIVFLLGIMHLINVAALLLRRRSLTASPVKNSLKHTNH